MTFGYGDRPVLEDVSLSLDAGAFLGLVGPNGSGKSTLLELLLGLRRPDAGTIRLFGESAPEFADGERLAYVAQDATAVADGTPMTVREVVRMGRYPRRPLGRFRDADRAAVADALDRTGVADLADRRVGRLSGGQRQRVFIARALAAEADLLALDEPTVGVDADSRDGFYELLADLNAEGLTVVLVEHDVGLVTAYASEVACLNRELHFHGDPESLLDGDALVSAYGSDTRLLGHDH